MTTNPGENNGWKPVTPGNTTRSGATALSTEKSGSAESGENVTQLREGIEQTRRELGDTVDALVAKTDVKGRAQERARQAKATAQERLQTARGRAEELGTQAKATVTAPENAPKVKGGAAAAAGVAAVGAAIWMLQRRRRRPRTPWDKAVCAMRDAAERARGPVGQTVNAIATSDVAVQAAEKARQAAAAPEARPRAEGAGAALGALLVLTILRRAARRMPDGR
ncbi:DUF3618 domain-containing protein [Actinocorallia populi]|uniref:DUF3618 domain-containing protein n=1 Tax=Actinocorallia populi TaxID=2079200 RepID=UPI000D08BA3D|nr:DUF3618 domain-containing protein [Actinocorallia populi]